MSSFKARKIKNRVFLRILKNILMMPDVIILLKKIHFELVTDEFFSEGSVK